MPATYAVVTSKFQKRPGYSSYTKTTDVWPTYSHDLAPSDFRLFLHLKMFLGGKRFDDDDDPKDVVQKWLTSQAAASYEEGIQNNGGEYVEK